MESTIRFHAGLRLWITALDGGPLHPDPEEQPGGWLARGNAIVSPPLAEGLEIPLDQNDEWYLFDEPPPPDWRPEIFVNYGGFTVVPIDEIYKTYNPTWDRHGLDWLVPIQERFWEQVERVNPVSYMAIGDQDIVVSQRREFIEQLRAGA